MNNVLRFKEAYPNHNLFDYILYASAIAFSLLSSLIIVMKVANFQGGSITTSLKENLSFIVAITCCVLAFTTAYMLAKKNCGNYIKVVFNDDYIDIRAPFRKRTMFFSDSHNEFYTVSYKDLKSIEYDENTTLLVFTGRITEGESRTEGDKTDKLVFKLKNYRKFDLMGLERDFSGLKGKIWIY